MVSSIQPPQVPEKGPEDAWLVELVTYNGAPFHDHWAYFVRSRSNKDRGVYINAVGNVRTGFVIEFERGFDLSEDGNRPTTRVALQWVDDGFMEGGMLAGEEGYMMDIWPVSGFEKSACKVPPPAKSLNDERNSGRRVVQRDCQTWIVESADQLVRDGIFKAEVAAYLNAVKQ